MTKIHAKADSPGVEGRYSTYVKQMIDLIGPKHLRLVAGRGMTKTTDVIADRSIEVCYDMPRSLQAFVSDTFVNARTNIVPTLIEGWREYKGWIEGKHYVVDERPPSFFGIPYKPVTAFKNTITVFNGCTFLIGSLDQPSGLAGNSFQHVYGDEAKYLNKKKLDVIMPALRGYNKFAHSPYYRGTTFTTDLPNLTKNDYDWILDAEKQMDLEQIKTCLAAGMVLNEINHDIYRAYIKKDNAALIKAKKRRELWKVRWVKARKESTFFYVVSSLANVDMLTPGYIYDALKNLGWEEFKQSVLSFKSSLEDGDKFYIGLDKEHFYKDGLNETYLRSSGIKDQDTTNNSQMLRHIDHNAPLDVGIDFGKMISLSIGQHQGDTYRILKFMFVLAPDSSKEIAEKFISFFYPHQDKRIKMYYDRSGNQYESSGRSWAQEIKNHLELTETNSRTGWTVELMSREQGNILQSEEYFFMKQITQGTNPDLPKLQMDFYQCRELKSSMESTKLIQKKDTRTGHTIIHKDKSSESLPLHKLPMHSTNPSDSAKYLLMRKDWVKTSRRDRIEIFTSLEGI